MSTYRDATPEEREHSERLLISITNAMSDEAVRICQDTQCPCVSVDAGLSALMAALRTLAREKLAANSLDNFWTSVANIAAEELVITEADRATMACGPMGHA